MAENHGERISAIEAQQEQLTRDVHSLATSVRELGDETRQSFSRMRTALEDTAKVPWGPIIAGASLIITIIFFVIAGFGSSYVRDLNRVEKDLQNVKEKKLEHVDKNAGQDERMRALERAVFNEHTGR